MRLLLTLLSLFALTSSVSALTTPMQTQATPLVNTEIDQTLTFNQFDPSLGTLNQIRLTVEVDGEFDITLTNGAATSQNVEATATSRIDVDSTLFGSLTSVTVSGLTGPRTLTAGQTLTLINIPGTNTVIFTVTFTPTQNNFVGLGTVNIRFTSLSGLSSLGGGGQLSSSQNTQVQVEADVEYIYTAPAVVQGDPQFAGFQGQQFQFHGLPDTVFNLVSAPEVQMNAKFVYIASGATCNYNETACFSHAGTYLGRVGVAIGSELFTIVSGPHSKGLSVFAQTGADQHQHAMVLGAKFAFTTAHGVMSISHPTTSMVEIRTPNFVLTLVNSDSFLNLEASLLNTQLLHTGAKHHHIKHCSNTQEIEASLIKHYPIKNYIHGLVGQTWRAVTFCNQPYQGVVGDYIASGLFTNDYAYNFFNATEY